MSRSGSYVIFAGTWEGRVLADRMAKAGIRTRVCVATEYGKELLEDGGARSIHQGRLDQAEMESFFLLDRPRMVIDATHPYAVLVTENIKKACQNLDIPYARLLRESCDLPEEGLRLISCGTAREAAVYLQKQEGRILLTTGSKDLPVFTEEITDKTRLFVRLLPMVSQIQNCLDLGLLARQLICMQGPFSVQMNEALLDHCQAEWLVTKESGQTGGFLEKLEAARRKQVSCIVIQRPVEETGYGLEDLWNYICRQA